MGSRRIAQALWTAWAIVVWNVVFDHVIVVAGREYLAAAMVAAHGTGPYARMDDWMRPAIAHGLWIATAASAVILLIGFVAIRHVTTPTQGPPNQPSPRLRRSAEASAEAEGGRHGKTVQNGKTVESGGVA